MTITRLDAQRGANYRSVIHGGLFLKRAVRRFRSTLKEFAVAAHHLAMRVAERGAELEQRLRVWDVLISFPDPRQRR